MKKRFLFIADIIDVNKTAIKLFEGCTLRKANDQQIEFIKEVITPLISIATPAIPINKYEMKTVKNNDQSYSYVPIQDRKNWKYYIIEHKYNEQYMKLLQEILFLSSTDLTLVFETINLGKAKGYTHDSHRIVNFYLDTHFDIKVKKITKKEISEFRRIKDSIENLSLDDFPFITKAIKDFVQIRNISDRSPFKILSCFSILELLLTTNNSGSEKSLSHQLKKKINLINNQLKEQININHYFGKLPDTTDIESVIALLYNYRSDIAHGNKSDFNKKLSAFNKKQDNILPFLIDVVRSILRFAIENPKLITDIKEC